MSAVIVAGHGPSWALPMMGQWQCCPVIHSNGVLQEIGVLLVSLKRPLNSVTRAQNSLFQGSNSSTLGTTPSICDFVFSLLGSTPCHLESQALAANGSNVPPPPPPEYAECGVHCDTWQPCAAPQVAARYCCSWWQPETLLACGFMPKNVPRWTCHRCSVNCKLISCLMLDAFAPLPRRLKAAAAFPPVTTTPNATKALTLHCCGGPRPSLFKPLQPCNGLNNAGSITSSCVPWPCPPLPTPQSQRLCRWVLGAWGCRQG